MKALILAIAGVAILTTGADKRVKIAASFVCGVSGAIALARSAKSFRGEQGRMAEIVAEGLSLEAEIKKRSSEIEVYCQQKKLEADAQLRAIAKREQVLIEREQKVEKELSDLDSLITGSRNQADATIKAARNEAQKLKEEAIQEIEERRKEIASDWETLEQLKAIALSEGKALGQSAIEEKLQELEQERIELERQYLEVEAIKVQQQGLLQIEKSKLESDRAIFECDREASMLRLEQEKAQIQQELAALAGEKAEWEEYQKKEMRRLQQQMDEIKDDIIAEWEKEAKEENKKKLEEKVAPYIQKTREIDAENKELRDRLKVLYEKLEDKTRPIKPKGMAPRNVAARLLIEFYEKLGIFLDCENAVIQANDIHVFVKPHMGVTRKDIERHFETLTWEFELSETPVMGTSPDGYQIILKPLNSLFFGLQPGVADPVAFRATMPRRYAEMSDGEDADAFNRAVLDGSLTDEDHKYNMLNFNPPTRCFTGRGDVTLLEQQSVDWYWNWREKSTGRPNVRSQNELLEILYGVKPGRGTDKQTFDGETLRGRLHRILDSLEIEYRSKKRQG